MSRKSGQKVVKKIPNVYFVPQKPAILPHAPFETFPHPRCHRFAASPKITDLRLNDNRIGPFGTNALALAMECSAVQTLTLSSAYIGLSGARALSAHVLVSPESALKRLGAFAGGREAKGTATG